MEKGSCSSCSVKSSSSCGYKQKFVFQHPDGSKTEKQGFSNTRTNRVHYRGETFSHWFWRLTRCELSASGTCLVMTSFPIGVGEMAAYASFSRCSCKPWTWEIWISEQSRLNTFHVFQCSMLFCAFPKAWWRERERGRESDACFSVYHSWNTNTQRLSSSLRLSVEVEYYRMKKPASHRSLVWVSGAVNERPVRGGGNTITLKDKRLTEKKRAWNDGPDCDHSLSSTPCDHKKHHERLIRKYARVLFHWSNTLIMI